MKPATTRKKCKYCKSTLLTTDSRKIFCNKDCKSRHRSAPSKASATRKDFESRYSNPFFGWMVDQSKRAGTVEIWQGFQLQDLLDTHNVYRLWRKANGYRWDVQKYDICHIFPVSHPDSIGTCHASNLVVADSTLNKRHGSKYYKGGRSIPRKSVSAAMAAIEAMTRSEVLKKIIAIIGKDVMDSFIRKGNLQASAKQSLLNEVEAYKHEYSADELYGMTAAQLRVLRDKLKGRISDTYNVCHSPMEPFHVYCHELRRHNKAIASLYYDVWSWMWDAHGNCTIDYRNIEKLNDYAFSILHGNVPSLKLITALVDLDGLNAYRERKEVA
ncbi:hypothetical protein P3W53_26080 [Pseudomonas denitrificans (nom. rej.)]|nr:hypothetical protein [Pseudomonas denitrificans (nom. rej.)]